VACNDLRTNAVNFATAIQYLVGHAITTAIYGIGSQFSQLWLHRSKVSCLSPSVRWSISNCTLVSVSTVVCPSYQMGGGFFVPRARDLGIPLI
jgi:hypothetical protein